MVGEAMRQGNWAKSLSVPATQCSSKAGIYIYV